MDYRAVRGVVRHSRGSCGRCGRPLVCASGRQSRLGGVILYLFATVVVGLPLAFPNLIQIWVFVDLGLAVIVGAALCEMQRRLVSRNCPHCELPSDSAIMLRDEAQIG